jgi:DNA-directed RNA polymerase specialized sigma subunit
VPLDELLGEARLALVEAAGRYDEGRETPLGAYVTLVVRRRLNQVASRWRQPTCFTDVDDPEYGVGNSDLDPPCRRIPQPDRAAAVRELLDRVRRSMPQHWFAVLRMHFVQGHTKEDIAREMGVTRQYVQQLIGKAVERARRHCPGECAAS